MKKIDKIFSFLEISEKLKDIKRWKNVKQMVNKDTSASHSWSLAVFTYIVGLELDLKLDLYHAVNIALAHDLAESLTDDVDSFLIHFGLRSAEEKYTNEKKAIKKIKELLPKNSNEEIFKLWQEYRDGKTGEAKFVRALDKIEGRNHMVYCGHTSFHYADFIGLYCHQFVEEFPALFSIHKEQQRRLRPQFIEHGWEWKDEYELSGFDELISPEAAAKIFDFMDIAEKMKESKRWLNTKEMVNKESSADHSWNLSLLVPIIVKELDIAVDLNKSLLIALTHDLVEALAGDTDHSLIAFGLKSKEEKQRLELEAMETIRQTLPKKSGTGIKKFWLEYEEGKTKEARFIKALDKIETINHMVVIGADCFDYPELIAPYPKKAVINFPELIPMYRKLLERLKPAYEKRGWVWEEDYEI